ncbi:MAG: hypothetical protein PVF17_04175 [Ignavibacteria bacterium]|jgi:hypothetical protein
MLEYILAGIAIFSSFFFEWIIDHFAKKRDGEPIDSPENSQTVHG